MKRGVALLVAALLASGCGGTVADTVRVTIPRGSGWNAAVDSLAARGAIDSPARFKLWLRFNGGGRAIQPGVYDLPAGASWSDIVRKLASGDVARARLTIPEGWTAAQIAERIAQVSGTPADSVLRVLTDTASATRFGVPGPTLEGYLYPATYEFPLGASDSAVIRRLVERYKQAWTPELRALADSAGLAEREVVTLASIVEKEAKVWDERPLVAAVYRNRLRIGMRLQADPTVQYALGEHQNRLLYSHIRNVADHPYNTYTQNGLPPGPIASPSAGAIRATLDPADVPYLYFVARPNGTHVFTRSLAEHNRAKASSRREARGR